MVSCCAVAPLRARTDVEQCFDETRGLIVARSDFKEPLQSWEDLKSAEDSQELQAELYGFWPTAVILVTRGILAAFAVFLVVEIAAGIVVDLVFQLFMLALAVGAISGGPLTIVMGAPAIGLLGIALHMTIAERWIGVLGIVLSSVVTLTSPVLLVILILNYGCCFALCQGAAWQVGRLGVLTVFWKKIWRWVCGCSERPTFCCWIFACVLRIVLTVIFYAAVVLCLGTAIVIFATENPASSEDYDARLVLPSNALAAGRVPPIELGTPQNIDMASYPHDFTGIWWLRWHDEPIPLYSDMHLEEVVTFAGMHPNPDENGKQAPIYPIRFNVPSGQKYRWGFANTMVSRVAMYWQSGKNPFANLHMDLQGAGSISIGGGKSDLTRSWKMYKVNDNEWLRWVDRGDGEDGWYYMLSRIVFSNGTAHPQFLDDYLNHMKATKIRVYTTNSRDCRKCGTYLFGTPGKCKDVCS